MTVLRFLFLFALFVVSSHASGQLQFCNKTNSRVQIAVRAELPSGKGVTSGWWTIAPGLCKVIENKSISDRTFFYVARAIDGGTSFWSGDDSRNCVDIFFNFDYQDGVSCESRGKDSGWLKMARIKNDGKPSFIQSLSDSNNPYAQIVTTGVIKEHCLISYDDSIQVDYMEDPVIELNYQRGPRTHMKKLAHCYKLTVVGPLDVQGIAKAFVDNCVDYGLNHNKTVHILGLLAAIGGDVWGGGGGAYSSAKLSEYVASATNETIGCLSDEAKISDYIKDYLQDRFDATVKEESHWVYWTL